MSPGSKRKYTNDICLVDGCERPRKPGGGGYGMCRMHAQRMAKHGDPDVLLGSGRWKGDDAGYSAVHMRLRRWRPIASYQCIDCGAQAQDWTYNKSGIAERVGTNGFRYSTDLDQYDPRCRPCHNRYDHPTEGK